MAPVCFLERFRGIVEEVSRNSRTSMHVSLSSVISPSKHRKNIKYQVNKCCNNHVNVKCCKATARDMPQPSPASPAPQGLGKAQVWQPPAADESRASIGENTAPPLSSQISPRHQPFETPTMNSLRVARAAISARPRDLSSMFFHRQPLRCLDLWIPSLLESSSQDAKEAEIIDVSFWA